MPKRVVAVQFDIAWEDRQENHRRVEALVSAAAVPAGSLIVLPEMFALGFTMDAGRAAAAAGGETARFLADLARRHRSTVVAGEATRGDDGLAWNEALVFGPDGHELARFRKLHPFTLAGEAERYAAGSEVVLFDWDGVAVAPFICYDLRFPEAFRAAAAAGAELLLVLANWPSVRARHWTLLLQARAVENLAYVVGVNRSGRDPAQAYSGGSMIVDPSGEVIARAGTEAMVLAGDVDRDVVHDVRRRLPFLKDLRPELLGRIPVRRAGRQDTVRAR